MNNSAFDGDRTDRFATTSAGEVIRGVGRRWRSVLITVLILMPLAVAAVLLVPAQFDSYAQLLIRLGRGSVALDPTTSLSGTVSLLDSRQSQVNSVREMFGSRAVAARGGRSRRG